MELWMPYSQSITRDDDTRCLLVVGKRDSVPKNK